MGPGSKAYGEKGEGRGLAVCQCQERCRRQVEAVRSLMGTHPLGQCCANALRLDYVQPIQDAPKSRAASLAPVFVDIGVAE